MSHLPLWGQLPSFCPLPDECEVPPFSSSISKAPPHIKMAACCKQACILKTGDSRGNYVTEPQATQKLGSWAISALVSPALDSCFPQCLTTSLIGITPPLWLFCVLSPSLCKHFGSPRSHPPPKSAFGGGWVRTSFFTPKVPLGQFPKPRAFSPHVSMPLASSVGPVIVGSHFHQRFSFLLPSACWGRGVGSGEIFLNYPG